MTDFKPQALESPPPYESEYGGQYEEPALKPPVGQSAPGPYGGEYEQPVMRQPVVQQPGHHTTVVVANVGGTQAVEGPREWRSGICDCFNDMNSCLIVGALECVGGSLCYGGHLSMRMNESCCLVCVPGYLVALRTKLRVENNIQGSICDDCIKTVFCRPCAMCQMTRELDSCQ